MKSIRSASNSGNTFPRSIQFWGVPLLVSVLSASSLMGQMADTPGKDNPAPASKETVLMKKVMTDLPHYGDNPTAIVTPESKPLAGETPEIVQLVPYHVVGEKGLKLGESELLTKKAYAAGIFKEYDYSVFSNFQHREATRVENVSSLRSFADSLKLVGDSEGSHAVRQESDRLFLRPHDPESNAIDQLFNPRFR